MVAGDDAGKWRPAPGFRWVTSRSGDFRVSRVGRGARISTSGRNGLPKLLGAYLANLAAENSRQDDGIMGVIAEAAMIQLRDGVMDSALRDLLADEPPAIRQAVGSVLTLAMEGRLDLKRLLQREGNNYLVQILRAEAGEFGNIYQAAQLIRNAILARRRTRR